MLLSKQKTIRRILNVYISLIIFFPLSSAIAQVNAIDGEYRIREFLEKGDPFTHDLGPLFVFKNGEVSIVNDITVSYGSFEIANHNLILHFPPRKEVSTLKIKENNTLNDDHSIILEVFVKHKQNGKPLNQGYFDLFVNENEYTRFETDHSGRGKVLINHKSYQSITISSRGMDASSIELQPLYGKNIIVECLLMPGQVINPENGSVITYPIIKNDRETLILKKPDGTSLELVKMNYYKGSR